MYVRSGKENHTWTQQWRGIDPQQEFLLPVMLTRKTRQTELPGHKYKSREPFGWLTVCDSALCLR